MPAILPAISALFSDARLSSSVKVPLLYSWNEYREVIGNIIASNAFNFYSYIGISACILLGVFTMLTSKGDTWLKTLWIISFTSCLIPIAGYFMNGMTYVANRHSWIFTMISKRPCGITRSSRIPLSMRYLKPRRMQEQPFRSGILIQRGS